jgi:hypothetical protein
MHIGTVWIGGEEDWSFYLEVDSVQMSGRNVAVEYKTYNGGTDVTLSAVYKCLSDRIEIHYDLTVPSSNKVVNAFIEEQGAMFECLPLNPTSKATLFKRGLWKRHKKDDGTSYEVKDGYFRFFKNPDKNILLKILSEHEDWTSDYSQHIPFLGPTTDEQAQVDRYTSDFEIYILPKKLSLPVAAAVAAGRSAVVEISTAKDYNLIKPGNDARQYSVTISNARSKLLEGKLTVTARTLDNKKIDYPVKGVTLKGLDTTQFGPFDLPEAEHERELYFIDASLAINGKEECFSRTNVAILPDFPFAHRDESVFGISDFFDLPSRASALELLKRMGVHHLRGCCHKDLSQSGFIAFASRDVEERFVSDQEKKKELRKIIHDIKVCQNPFWEFGNEWNLTDPDLTDDARIELRRKLARNYCRWTKHARSILGESSSIQLITQGLSSGDTDFLDLLQEFGCYDRFNGFAFHPARNEYTADADDEDLKMVGIIDNWNYYGQVKNCMEYARNNRDITAYATEVYACTWPNEFPRDSYRQAAANIVLSLALGLAEGLSSIQVYQLNDSIREDIGGINHKDEEYHFGLLMRDYSLKPSAMAYATTAEILDGAKFDNKYPPEDDADIKLRALVFRTDDDSKVTILWDRTEGYVQGYKEGFYHKEPWLPSYSEKRPYTFKTDKPDGEKVKVVDMIGRKYWFEAKDGTVEIDLDGEPVFV